MRVLPSETVSLMHYVELNRAGWYHVFVARCVVAALWLNKDPASKQKIRHDINLELGPSLRNRDLNTVISTLQESGELIRLNDGRYKLSVTAAARTKNLIADFGAVEQSTKESFCRGIKALNLECPEDRLWNAFVTDFLVPLVENEGARSYTLLVGDGVSKQPHLDHYIDGFLASVPPEFHGNTREFVRSFFTGGDVNTTKFFLSYLDAYFLRSVSGLPRDVLSSLSAANKGKQIRFTVFVDTNFIFSILGLHDNPSNEAAQDLMELPALMPEGVTLKFAVAACTVEETQKSIAYHRKRLEGVTYPKNVAEAATEAEEISGVMRTFFERVTASGVSTDAKAYFEPYENGLVRILSEKGIGLVPSDIASDPAMAWKIDEDVEDRLIYVRGRYGHRAKTKQQLTHDITLRHLVLGLRDPAHTLPLETEFWIVTVDYTYQSYDRYMTNKSDASHIPACLHPSELIQLCRFLLPRSQKLSRALLGSIRAPMLREFSSEAEEISIRIANLLARHEGIEDIEVETLSRVLADEAVRDCFDSTDYEKEGIAAIDSALARQVAEQQKQLDSQSQTIAEMQETVGKVNARNDELMQEKRQSEELARANQVQLISALGRQIREKQGQKSRLDRRATSTMRFVLLTLLVPYLLVLASLLLVTLRDGWDKAEPWTFFLGVLPPVAGYLYFFVTTKEPTPKGIYESLLATVRTRLYCSGGFDARDLCELEQELLAMEASSSPSTLAKAGSEE